MKRPVVLFSCLLLAAGALSAADEKPAIDPAITIAQLNKVIEAQALRIISLQAQLDDATKGGAAAREIAADIAKMQTACVAKGATLAINPQTGLYAPDAKGMPRCVPDPAKPAEKEAPKK